MRNQSLRVFLYSSLSIVALALVWGFRQIPAQGKLAHKTLQESLDQEMIVLNGAVKACTQAMKYRLLDVLKAEGNDHVTRTFEDSPFIAASLLEWDQVEWKSLWYSNKSKTDLQNTELTKWLKEWPLSKLGPEEVHFSKVADLQGQPYFVILVPVRRPNQVPMMGVGIFPASQFGLSFSADENREIRVFDSQGFALALSHPAYLGTSLKAEPIAQEILQTEDVSTRLEWTGERGTPMVGLASRLSDSNLLVAIEAKSAAHLPWSNWLYLFICTLAACAINWALFKVVLQPLLDQLALTEANTVQLRKQLSQQQTASPPVVVAPIARTPKAPALSSPKLKDHDFIEDKELPEPMEVASGKASLAKIMQAALRALDRALQGVDVHSSGLEDLYLETDSLQLQTAIEEIVKNASEAMSESQVRRLTISGAQTSMGLQLKIQDSGVGIPASDLGKVFDPFFSSKDSEGVARGLGLNVVRRVVEELHGRVTIQSHLGSGTTVEILWPEAGVLEPRSQLRQIGLELSKLAGDLDEEDFHQTPIFTSAPLSKPDYPEFTIRKPKVRTLD